PRLALVGASRLTLMGASRLALRLAAIVMKESPESFQEPMAAATAATSAIAATRVRRGRRIDRGCRRCRLIGACEPGRRYQQERSVHEKFLRLGTQPRLRAAAAVAGDLPPWIACRPAPSVCDAVYPLSANAVFFLADPIC